MGSLGLLKGERVGLSRSKLGTECWHHVGSYKWPSVYAGKWGREMPPTTSFVPEGVSL